MAAVNPPRGMRDFLPADKARRERVLAVIRDRYRAHGFDEIETPVVEEYDRLHSGMGGDNEKLAFNVLKRGLDADAIRAAADDSAALSDLGLRFDLTVPLARFYASHRAELPEVFRAIQIAPVWRAERPQKGRYRQFVQCDIDIIGDPSARAEAELIVATLDTLDALGLEGGGVRINDRRALDAMLDVFGFAGDERPGVLITIDKLDHLVDLGDAVRAARGADRVPLVFDPFLVRGMGYYTGTIFELAHPSVPYSLGGGGRYDGMIGRFLGQDVPAVGFSIGFERIVDLIDARADAATDAVVLVHDRDVPVAELVALKSALVARGARVRLEQRKKNLKALLERATADGYTSFAVVSAGADAAALELKPLG
ncbi:MAG: histidine--tRNA ligase [Microbacterium sp.]|nr:histidine--tRNA ligase [Microbacterium sp.]